MTAVTAFGHKNFCAQIHFFQLLFFYWQKHLEMKIPIKNGTFLIKNKLEFKGEHDTFLKKLLTYFECNNIWSDENVTFIYPITTLLWKINYYLSRLRQALTLMPL